MKEAGTIIYSRDCARKGVTTGRVHHCDLEGCRGVRISVKWEDGRRSFPCTKGLVPHADGFKIA